MFLKSEAEGYLEINTGAGLSAEDAAKGPPGTMPIPADKKIQLATLKCTHCPKGIVFNPFRSRPRGYCRACDHYICDECAVVMKVNGGNCVPYKKLTEITLNQMMKGLA
jgi:hypothetical protein